MGLFRVSMSGGGGDDHYLAGLIINANTRNRCFLFESQSRGKREPALGSLSTIFGRVIVYNCFEQTTFACRLRRRHWMRIKANCSPNSALSCRLGSVYSAAILLLPPSRRLFVCELLVTAERKTKPSGARQFDFCFGKNRESDRRNYVSGPLQSACGAE